MAQSAGATDYTDYNECPRYNAKKSDGEALVMLQL